MWSKHTVRGFCLIIFALAVASSLHAQETTASEELALQAYRQGEVERAVELYTQALSETDDPAHHARLQVQIAWNLFNIGRLDEVKTHLRAALLEDPNLTLMSDYYTPDFLEIFEQARRTNFESGQDGGVPLPDLENTLTSINDRIAAESDLEGALADVNQLLAAYPRDGRLIPIKAQLLTALGRAGEAEGLGGLDPAGVDGQIYGNSYSVTDLVLRADRLLEQGDATTALQLARQAHSLSPSNYMALEQMAEAAQKAADWKSAEYALKTALSLQPDNIDLKLRLGEVYLATFEASAARDVFTSLTEDYPHSDRTWAALGLLEARLGNFERALDALGRAIHENSLLPEVQLANGELLLLQGDVNGAMKSLESAANLLRNDPQLEARLGQAKLARGQYQQALTHLRAAVEGGFDEPDVSRSLALALALNELYSESERVLEQNDADERGDTQVIRGFLALKQEEYSEAEAILKVVAVSRPSDPASVNLLAASIYPQARYEESVVLLTHALELDAAVSTVERNLEKARAARAAELLGENAKAVRALPK